MPIIPPPVTEDDRDAWLRNSNAPPPFIHQVAKWPRHVTPRTNCAYRLKYIKDGAFCPMRWFGHWRSLDFSAPPWVDGWFDVVPDGPGRLVGSTGFTPTGYSVDAIIQSNEANPITGNPGISLEQRVVKQADGSYFFNRFSYDFDTPQAFPVPCNQWLSGFSAHSDGFSGPFGWTNNDSYVASVGSCYEFVKVSPPPPDEFAHFNGVDAYIQFDKSTDQLSEPWKIECDLFIRELNKNYICSNTGNANSYLALRDNHCYWGNNRFPLNPSYPFNQWFHLKVTFDWDFAGNFVRVWIDGQLVGFEQQGNLAKSFNRLGVYTNSTPSRYGDFDMKNLTMMEGGPGNPLIRLDMPLELNACSSDPSQIKGITHNMSLPSCP